MLFEKLEMLGNWREKRVLLDDIKLSWLVAAGCVSAILLCGSTT